MWIMAYPFVTSSNTVPAMAATGSGTGPNRINYIGITKAYTTGGWTVSYRAE